MFDINNMTTGEWVAITSLLFVVYQVFEKFISPVIKAKMNIESNSKKVEEIDELRKSMNIFQEESRTTDRLLVKAMIAIIDNQITGNSHDNLKNTKEDLMVFLTKQS